MGLLEPVAKLPSRVAKTVGPESASKTLALSRGRGRLVGTVESADPLEARDLEELQDSFSKKRARR